MTHIIFRNVGFAYPGSEASVFLDLNLIIDVGWRSALVGRNGRGKTTLLRLIHRTLAPDSGSIEASTPTYLFPGAIPGPDASVAQAVKDAVGPFSLWEQEMGALLDEQTPEALDEYSELESAYKRNNGYEIDAWIERELDAVHIPAKQRQRPFATLSGGEQTRAFLAALFVQPHGYPLVDEPTNHLDLAGRQQVARYLQSKRGFLLVSHDRHFLDEAVDHVVSLNKSDVTTTSGDYSTWQADFDADQQRELARNTALTKDIKRLTRAAGQRRSGAHNRESDKAAHTDKGYIGHMAAKQMKRALNIERRSERELTERRGLLKNHEKVRSLKLASDAATATGSPVLTATNLGLNRGPRTLFESLSFTVKAGDRLAVCGGNGTGKTSLLDVLCEDLTGYRGIVKTRGQLKISRGYQNPLWQCGRLDAHLDQAGLDHVRFRQIMAVLGVAGEVLTQPIEDLSHGQRKKIDLARSFAQPGDLLIWDEPLNFLDVESRRQLADVILKDEPTLIFVEHDRHFVEAVATASLTLPS